MLELESLELVVCYVNMHAVSIGPGFRLSCRRNVMRMLLLDFNIIATKKQLVPAEHTLKQSCFQRGIFLRTH